MAILKTTFINQITIMRDGTFYVQLDFELIDDTDGSIIGKREDGFHRFTIPPGANPAEARDVVNAHLTQMGWPTIPANEFADVNAIIARFQTPDKIAAYQAKKTQTP